MSLKPADAGRPRLSPQDPWSPAEPPPGYFPPSPRSDVHVPPDPQQSISAAVHARRNEYVHKKTIKVKVGSWNVASMSGTEKDLGGWFVHGLGAKGMAQDLSGVNTDVSDSGTDTENDAVESVHDQEQRLKKKTSTLPENDTAACLSRDEVGLYVLGLQEVVDVSSVTETIRPYTDPNPGKKWKKALRRALPRGYKKVAEHQLLGLLLLIFAAPDVAPHITSVDVTSVGTGVLGYLGNKGAVSARIVLGEATKMIFVNCHLAAGADQAALTRRIWDTNQILTRTKFTPVTLDGETGKSESIGDEDFAFWFGDLNYRLDGIPGDDVRRLLLLHARNEYDVSNTSKRKIDSELGYLNASASDLAPPSQFELDDEESDHPASEGYADPQLDPKSDPASLQTTLQSLLAHDQLHSQQRLRKAFYEGWREGEINFLPTYKYDIGSVGMFDSGEKKRSPSWCDRILFRTKRDKELYEERVHAETQAKQKDDEMRKRGLDAEAAQEDVLFDYDPETDGDNYAEDADDLEEDIHDVELIQSRDTFEDLIEVEGYISHQRVLSSDHKPLTAVFTLTYDSVDPDLKAKIHQEVARGYDKAENEGRPNVTVVLDQPHDHTPTADQGSDLTELKLVGLGEIRFDVPRYRTLTIANTGQTDANFAFIDRPGDESGSKVGAFPKWLDVHVDQEPDVRKIGPPDLGSSIRYRLPPGETTNVELTVNIKDLELVRALNSGELALDDVLVLRISNGRDHFIPIKGVWQQTCYCRTLEELVRVPTGVRSLTLKDENVEVQRKPSGSVHHSAPPELFALTEAIPSLVERVVAEWSMLHEDETPPWDQTSGYEWPFKVASTNQEDRHTKEEQLASVREAMDTGMSVEQHLDGEMPPLTRLELLAETLVTFLHSLRDGILNSQIWHEVESRLAAAEKSKSQVDSDTIQEMVMEALSTAPVHSVSFTFITFMLNKVITELSATPTEAVTSPKPSGRSRSSTAASEALSEVSITSEQSSRTKRSFLSSLTHRAPNPSSQSTAAVTNTTNPNEKRKLFAHAYAEVFAPLIIRSEVEHKTTSKEKKAMATRKIRVLEAFLSSAP